MMGYWGEGEVEGVGMVGILGEGWYTEHFLQRAWGLDWDWDIRWEGGR